MQKELKEAIINEFIKQFNQYGHKLTLDLIASSLHISKKTIYKYFNSKTEIYETILNEAAEEVRIKQIEIYKDKTLTTKEKLFAILTIKTQRESQIDISKLFALKKVEPKFYHELISSYENRWDLFISLANKGKEEGILKDETNPYFIVSLLTAGMEMVYTNDFLAKNQLTYTEAITMLAKTILEGIYR